MSLYNYTSYGRNCDDWRGRPMKTKTFSFLLHVWKVCWPFLTEVSRRSPPTHLQLLFYFVLLDGRMNPHRDNSCCKDIERIMEGEELVSKGHNSSGGAENSQQIGSNVLVYTEGTAPQSFDLRFPPSDNYQPDRKKKQNGRDWRNEWKEVIPSFQFTCGSGTVSVLDPIDDLLVTHQAQFVGKFPNGGYRVGFAIRWLGSERDFYTKTCGMRLDQRSLDACMGRKSFAKGKGKAEKRYPAHQKSMLT